MMIQLINNLNIILVINIYYIFISLILNLFSYFLIFNEF